MQNTKQITPMAGIYIHSMNSKPSIIGLKRYLDEYNPYDEDIRKMEEDVLREFGRKLRQMRKERGLTQEELGEKAGVCYKYIGEIERGEKNPTLLVIYKIAAALKVEPSSMLLFSDLCGDSDYKEIYQKELLEIIKGKDAHAIQKALRLLRVLFDE